MEDVTQLDLVQVRITLEQERDCLRRRLEKPGSVDDDCVGRAISFNPDRADLASEYAERELDVALQAIDREQLTQIEAALLRLDAGTYGLCLTCGEPIAPARLVILPHATLCVRCQSHRPTY